MQRAKAELRCGQAAQEPFWAALVLLVRVSLTWGDGVHCTHPALITEMQKCCCIHPGHHADFMLYRWLG